MVSGNIMLIKMCILFVLLICVDLIILLGMVFLKNVCIIKILNGFKVKGKINV